MPPWVRQAVVSGEARHYYYFDLWPLSGDLVRQIHAVHVRHYDVRQKQMNRAS
jgi:hypothetical protein